MFRSIRYYLLFIATQFLFISTKAKYPPSICGPFEESRICGPACPVTCDTLNTNICCDVRCVSGCFCRDGYILVSNTGPRRCVPIDGCPKPGILEIGNLTCTVVESMKIVVIVVLRVNGTAGEICVRYRTREGTAKERLDYVPTSGVLVFPDGVTFQTIRIGIVDDDIREPDEFFSVVLSDPTNKAEINSRRLDGVPVIIKDDDMRPGNLQMAQTNMTVKENIGSMQVTIVRLGGTDGILQLKYKTKDGTAVVQTDYQSVSGELIFNNGETRKTISIVILNDNLRESTETFYFQIFDITPGSGTINFRPLGTRMSTLINIIDDDLYPGYVEMAETAISVSEDCGTALIQVVRLGGSDGELRVPCKIIDLSAVIGLDYRATVTEIVFRDGETRKTISVAIIDDSVREVTETFRVMLLDLRPQTGQLGYRLLGSKRITEVKIIDNDVTPGYVEMAETEMSVSEDCGTALIQVVRLGGSDGELRVPCKIIDLSAVIGLDYRATVTEIVFRDGETRKTISVAIIDDSVREVTETFRVTLLDLRPQTGQLGYRSLGSKQITEVKIIDNDVTPGYVEMAETEMSVSEDCGTALIQVVRLGGSDGELRVPCKIIDLSAVIGLDYRATVTEIVFRDGETRKTISVAIIDDSVREVTETFRVTLLDLRPQTGQLGYRSLGSKQITEVKIIDNDVTPGYVEMAETEMSVSEDCGTALIQVVRLGGSDGELRVPCKIIDLSAVIGLDYRATVTEIVFRDGETRKTISVAIIDDSVREVTETFRVTLLDLRPQTGQLGYRLLGSKQITEVKIIDNDARLGKAEFEQNSLTIREDIGVAEMVVLRVDGTDGVLRVNYKAVVGTASVQSDYMIADGELVFQDGVDRMPIRFDIIDDRIKEPDETFSIIIYQPDGVQGRTLGRRTSLLVTIMDNDFYSGVFEFQSIEMSVPENIRTLSITIIRKDGTDGEVNLQIRTLKGTATEGLDYNLPPVAVLFPEGVAEQRINLQIIDDDVKEGDENFLIGLFNPTNGGVLGDNKILTVVILDDDDPCIIRFQRSTDKYRENVGLVEIPVIRENRVERTVSIRWRTEDVSARAGEDYRGASNALLIFEPNERIKTIKIAVMSDVQFERNELFDIVLFNPSEGAVLGSPSRFTVQLYDNEDGGKIQPSLPSIPRGIEISFRLQNIRVKENAGEVRIPIARVGATSPLTVRVQTKDGTATGGTDYRRTRGPVSFADGDIEVTVAIRLIDDDIAEPDETFTVELFDPSIGLVPLGLNVVTITIEDDDTDIYTRKVSSSSYGVVAESRSRGETVSSASKVSSSSYGVVAESRSRGETVSSASLLTRCPGNLILKTCANTCPPSCNSLLGKAPCSSNGCIRACFCPEGLVKRSESSNDCIKPSECPQPSHQCNKCSGSLLGGLSISGRSTPLKVL